MTTEQLPGLQMAVKLLAQIGDDDSDAAIAAVHDLAEAHAQRLTLQHHAADLEVKCVTLKELHDAATDELRERLAEIEAQEPVAISKAGNPQDWRGVDCRLFTRPAPAQAVPYELLKRCLLVMETNWTKIDDEWGSTDGGIEADIAAGYADEIRDLRKFLAAAPEHKA